ncbi:hypothetical protein PP1_031125 [Pseudonocardia sp. P1]|nr:hypothetical protein Ae707Ps1_6038 [Pseudonocardia sp. Ae707_Ps1]
MWLRYGLTGAALTARLDEGKVLSRMPGGLLRGVTGPGLHPDRVYVISSEVTSEVELIALAELFDPITEQLGTVKAQVLEG